MEAIIRCPECGAARASESTCQEHFHQMLFWEAETPSYGVVHHLTVLCYHLQHPSLYSPAGLTVAIQLLREFVETDISPADIRKRLSPAVDSSERRWKIKAALSAKGTYSHPVHWTMTAADVVSAGKENYCDSVRIWAESVHTAIALSEKTHHRDGSGQTG